jgi:hypothetical protein
MAKFSSMQGQVLQLGDDDSLFISKEVLPSLEGLGFVETTLGDSDGSLRQFRNSTGIHIREYEQYFEVHKDRFDPRTHPLKHLICDSPETLVAFGAASMLATGLLAAKKSAKGSKSDLSSFGGAIDFVGLFLYLNRLFGLLKKLLF